MWLLLVMAFSFAHGAIQWLAADAATTVYTVSGLAFQPKAIRFYMMGLGSASDTGDSTSHLRRSIGFAVGAADRRCVGSQDQTAAATMTCTTGYRTDCVAMSLTSTPAADGLLDLGSITSDGFTCVVDDQAPVNLTVFWEAWGGSDITVATIGEIAEPAATGNVDYTVTGFVAGNNGDQVVMFAGVQATGAAPTAARNDSGLFVGAATAGTVGENIVLVGNNDDGSAAADADGYGLSGECLAMITVAGGNPSARATLTQFGTNNFRLNWLARATTGRKSIFLAIKGGTWRVGDFSISLAVLNSTTTVSSLPFAPLGVSLMSRIISTAGEETAGTATAQDFMSLGTGSGTGSRRCMSAICVDGVPNAVNQGRIEYDEIAALADDTGALFTAFDIDAWNSDGFRFITDLAQSGEPTNAWSGYLTFGSAARSMPTFPRTRFTTPRKRVL